MKIIILSFILLFICGCDFQEGVEDFIGANTPEGELSPAQTLFGSLGPLLPAGLGVGLVVLARMVRSGARFKKAIYQSTAHAIESGDLSNANTVEEVKAALKQAQALHDDSKILTKSYKNFKNGEP
jgi:hypothetical protein